jgi:hypothetical protein
MIFTAKDLKLIEHQTDINYHIENYVFIAKKIDSPLLKVWLSILKDAEPEGMDDVLNDKFNKYRHLLMSELEKKSIQDYKNVNGVL